MSRPRIEPSHRHLKELRRGRRARVTIGERYLIDGVLGEGGMAWVYHALDLSSGRRVALKVLHERHNADPRVLRRFQAEARLLARVRSRHVVEALDFGSTSAGVVYLTMERLRGEDLHSILAREGPLSWPRARSYLLDICAGLRAIHAAGIVHLDLKPANCFCALEGGSQHIELLDFGVASRLADRASERTGVVVGTPEYMSPEQARGLPADERSDVYAMGLLIVELLTGRRPFAREHAKATMQAQIYDSPPRVGELADRGQELPPGTERIVARALRKARRERYPSVAALEQALLAWPTTKASGTARA